MQTLLQSPDVPMFTGISDSFPVCDLRTIHATEYNQFRVCLGLAFYDYLKEDLIDYSADLPWEVATVYVVDTVVKFKGIYYKATAGSTGKMPPNIDYWVQAPKFTTACLETLWCTFLGPYLAWSLLLSRFPFIYTQIKAEGIVKISGNDFKAADSKDYNNITAAIAREVEKTFSNLNSYMLANNADNCFDLYLSIANGCCGDCGLTKCQCEPDCGNNDGFEYRIA